MKNVKKKSPPCPHAERCGLCVLPAAELPWEVLPTSAPRVIAALGWEHEGPGDPPPPASFLQATGPPWAACSGTPLGTDQTECDAVRDGSSCGIASRADPQFDRRPLRARSGNSVE